MNSFGIAFNAIMPFVVYMAVGWLSRSLGLTDDEFLTRMNRMIFKMFFPLIMFRNFYNMDTSGGIRFGYVVFAFVLLSGLFIALMFIIGKTSIVRENPRKSVVIQGIFRSNAILFALPLCSSVFGDAGAGAAALLLTIIVPAFNILAVVDLEYFSGKTPTAAELIKRIITNPLILGAIAGVIFLLLPFRLPKFIEDPMEAFASLTTPMALFILGGSLKFSSIRRDMNAITMTLVFRLIIVPGIALLLMRLFAFEPAERFAVFAIFGSPVAFSSYPMAASMGGDADLAGEIVAFSTIISLFTLFVWILLIV